MRGKTVFAFLACFVVSAAISTWVLCGATGGTRTASANTEELMTVVIDAGHGGMDGGASSADGTQEKEINLAIAKCLAEEMKAYPIHVVMTREDDNGLYVDDERSIRQKKREDLLKRKEIMEADGVQLSVSIHLNSFPQDEKVYGPQVFYPRTQRAGTNVSDDENTAKKYAEAIQKSLETNIDDGRERAAMPKNDILLFQNTTADIVLTECGFLSNPVEAEKLKTAEYQQILARSIWSGINEILCLAPTEKCKIIDSANGEQ